MSARAPGSVELYRRLLRRHVAPYWRRFALSVLGMLVVAVSQPALAALMKPLLDGTFVDKNPALMKAMPFIIVGLMLLHGIGTFIAGYGSNWVGHKVVLDLREAMFRRLMQLPTGFFESNVSGNLISKFTFDVAQVAQAATSVVTVSVRDGLTIVGLLAWLVYLNWRLTLIALVVGPVAAAIVTVISRRLRAMSQGAQQAMGEFTQVLQEATDCHKVVKVFGGEAYESRRFSERAGKVRRFHMKQAVAAAASWPILQTVVALGLATIVYAATLQSAADQTTVGGFVSFLMAVMLLLAPLKRLTGVNESLQRGLAAAESAFRLLDQAPEPDTGSMRLGRAQGALRFEGVSFSYDGETDRYALRDVSFEARPGETVALVGASGSGKTTLANLIPRFLHPTGGRVTLDGHGLEELTLESLRRNVALVSQEVILFNDTVAANIAYGAMGNATESEIEAAARAAHAMEFIAPLPRGLQTLVGEKGVKLSGGQRQRLAIARAILKNAPILILDEATSALDTESERQVQAALDTLMKARTTLVIAHRLSTIERADRIVVLERGSVAEIGTHAELLARDGLYARLYRIQFREQEQIP